jgi:hypothetical protein
LKLDKGLAFVREKEILLRGAVWYVTVDLSVSEYSKVIGGLAQSLQDLTLNLGDEPARRQELRYLSMLAGELKGKLDNVLQMLPRDTRTKRGIFSLGGKALKFLFGAALSEDLEPINSKINNLGRRTGEIVHDAEQRMTVSREMDHRIRANAKTLAQMVHMVTLQSKEIIKEQTTLDQRINITRDQVINTARRASYTREMEMLLMKVYTDITNLALSLDIAALHKLTASLLPSHKFFEILRDIHVQLDQGYSLITNLKPENMHLFYASAEIAALATSDAIRLIVQIPLRTERRTYVVYSPIPLPTWEPNLGKFIQVQAGDKKIAIASDRRSYMILPRGYFQNCKEGIVVICLGTVPITARTQETCLSGLFFGTEGHELCSREIVREGFAPIFRKLPVGNSWLYSVEGLMKVECKCVGPQECPSNVTVIQGTGIIRQTEGCDLYTGQLTLPASRQFESRTEWSGPELVVPQGPDLLPISEVTYVREHQKILADIWNEWEDETKRSNLIATPITMAELRRQVADRTGDSKWIIAVAVLGFITTTTIMVSLCLVTHPQAASSLRAWFAGGRTVTNNPQRGSQPNVTTDRSEEAGATSRDDLQGNSETPRTDVIFQ